MPGEIGPVDLVLLCVKSYDLEQAAEQAVPLIGPNTVVLTPQNGIEIVDRLVPFFGQRPIVPAVKIPYKLSLGEWEGGTSVRTEHLLDVFQNAGFLVELREDIRAFIWEKFIVSCASLGVLALMRLPVGPVMTCPESYALCQGVMEEAAQVASASGMDLPEGIVKSNLDRLSGLPPHITSSLLRDIQDGRRMEVDDLNGAVVRRSKQLGVSIASPTSSSFYLRLSGILPDMA